MIRNKSKSILKFVDLFAGIGGFHQALKVFNTECVFASEIDKYARQTYLANHNITNNFFNEDITKISPHDIPEHDILCGGFPCQAFSIAGKMKGFEDVRGTLFFDIVRILEIKTPKVFLLENVKNIISHDKGSTFRIIFDILKNKLGYNVYYKILNAKNFGVPQNRERVYIVGFKENCLFSFPEPLNIETKVINILDKNVDVKYTISDKLWIGHQLRKERHKTKGNGFGYSLFDENSIYTSTISARYYKDGSEILISQQNNNPRKITPREAARLQGFPDNFIIPVSDVQAYKQFGNSVAVPVIKNIINNILLCIK
jgi:DNA (cytosine-5)-methyltransferase 1